MANKDTVISFKFLKPGGFALDGHGRFNPSMTTQYKSVPGVVGRFPYQDYDFNEVFEVRLKPEVPRPLPAYLKGPDYDDEMRRSFLVEQIKTVQTIHEENNKVRDEIDYHVSTGLIEKVGDTFLDESAEAETEAPVKSAAKTTKKD